MDFHDPEGRCKMYGTLILGLAVVRHGRGHNSAWGLRLHLGLLIILDHEVEWS